MRITKKFVQLVIIVAAMSIVATADDLKPAEIIAKHLDAIGKKEARENLKTLMAVGTSSFESKNPFVSGGGRGVVVSDPNNLFFVMSFNSNDYPFEKIGYFSGKVNLPYANAGARSLLGSFIIEHNKILSDGIFGGVMSLRWPFLDMEKRKPRVQNGGQKKINDRKVYALNYYITGGGSEEFYIRLYFDSETFNHVRSEFHRTIPPPTAILKQANQIANSTLVLIEDFSDFKTVDGLTLPHSYKADFVANSNTSVYQSIWGIKVGQYVFNQKLAPGFFTFDDN